MITLYTWTTPNGRKPAIMLEEIEMPYQVNAINLGKNEQFGGCIGKGKTGACRSRHH